MPILIVLCPDCDARVKSDDGFTAGEEGECPKCETVFRVPDPSVRKKAKPPAVNDDDDEERPKKKKKEGTKASEGSYANSPVRFIVLGVLVVAMLVLGYFLYKKLTAPPQEIVVPARTDGE